MTTKPLSPQQAAFVEELATSASPISLEACAGSGKTSTIRAGSWKLLEDHSLPPTSLACAFNVKNVKDLEKDLPPSLPARTMNSLGHRAWASSISNPITLDKRKKFSVLRELVPFKDSVAAPDLPRLLDLARYEGIVPEGSPGGLQGDTEEAWNAILDRHGLDVGNNGVHHARRVLAKMNLLGFRGAIDFADQLYLPIVYGSSFLKHDLLFVDEAQDLAPLQHDMLGRLLAPQGRLIIAGDARQAIYQFRGASQDSLGDLKRRFALKEMPLSVSFRCPRAVVAEARKYVSHIEVFEKALEGRVADLFDPKADKPGTFPASPGSAIICRNNAPLINMAFRLLRASIPCKVLGHDFGQGLVSLCKKLFSQATTSSDFHAALTKWYDRELSNARAADKPEKIDQITDRYAVLSEFLDAVSPLTLDSLTAKISDLFDEKKHVPVTLSTIHKAKGLEWPIVYALDFHLINNKWSSQELIQNLSYVLITRAQQCLFYINSKMEPIGA